MKWSLLWTHGTKAGAWSISFTGRDGPILITPGSLFPTWEMQRLLFATSTPLILPPHAAFAAFLCLISFSYSAMSGRRLLSLCLRHLIAWKSILRRGAVLHTLHPPPAMVLFFLFLFLPLTFAFVLTAVAVLCKPGCAVRAADMSSV